MAAFLLLLVLWVWVSLNWSYSEGERAGYIQKLSSKGGLCKTWEGETSSVPLCSCCNSVRSAAKSGLVVDASMLCRSNGGAAAIRPYTLASHT
jgi:hypothetical protein